MKNLLISSFLIFSSSIAIAQYRPAPVVDKPTIKQINGFTANVPMKHGSCGIDCGTHVLAVSNGNLNIKFQAGMICSGQKKVKYLAVKPLGQNTKVLTQNAPTSSVSHTLYLKPFSKEQLEKACADAMGGSWPMPGSHRTTARYTYKTIKKRVYVTGQCQGWANKTTRMTTARVKLKCEDKNFYQPVP